MDDDSFQVMFPAGYRPALERWLSSLNRELVKYPFTAEDDLPTYFLGMPK